MVDNLKSCTLCKISETRENILIPSFSPPKVPGMIISENPTSKEDKTGDFSDPSWNKVKKVLDYYGKNLDDFYITSGIKCSPEVNRYPEVNEIKNCSQFLLKEISIVEPKAILFLGESIAKFYVHVDTYSYINRKFKTRLCPNIYVTHNPRALRQGTQEYKEFIGIFRQFVSSCLI